MIPIIVIVGPTAAGKSEIAARLAEKIGGIIVNADARQIYRDIDIISAAPREQEREHARLYCFKQVNEPYSFAEYVRDADREIASIWAAGKIAIVVGGTGLYIDALLNRFVSPPAVHPEIRSRVQSMSVSQARDQLEMLDSAAMNTIDVQNPRRVQRALEVVLQTGQSITSFGTAAETSPYMPCMIGWAGGDRENLSARIEKRVFAMFEQGAAHEVSALLKKGYSLSDGGMQSIGVAEIAEYLGGACTLAQAQQKMIEHTRQYAKRQMTWFRRNKNIVWYTSFDDVWHSVHDFLQANYKQF